MKQFLTYILLVSIIFAGACGSKTETPRGEVKDWKKYVENQKALAIASYRRGNYKQALIDIEEARERSKNDPEVYLIKGIIYYGLKDFKKAEEYYEESLDKDDEYLVAHFNLCGLYIEMERPSDAVPYCEKAASDPLYENRASAYTHLGTAHFMQGNIAKAETYYGKALEIDPMLVYTHNELGKMHLSLGDEVEAIREFKIAIENYDKYEEAYYNLGIAYLKQGNKPSACSAFNRVVKLTPNSNMGLDAKKYIETVCAYSSNDIGSFN